jgi:hypothetical protein
VHGWQLVLLTPDARAVTKDSAYRLQRTCAESTVGGLACPFLDRSLAKDRAGTAGSSPPTDRWQDKGRKVRTVGRLGIACNFKHASNIAKIGHDLPFLPSRFSRSAFDTLRST